MGLIAPSVGKMQAALALLPRLERFARSVCDAALEPASQEGEGRPPRRVMEDALPVSTRAPVRPPALSPPSSSSSSSSVFFLLLGVPGRETKQEAEKKKQEGVPNGPCTILFFLRSPREPTLVSCHS